MGAKINDDRGGEGEMESTKVRLRLAGRRNYEQPVLVSFANRLPKTGDFIEVPHDGHSVWAQVTSTSSPICREGDVVTYLVYACESENQEIREGGGESAATGPTRSILIGA